MNCINHPETPVSAYCQNCGKALCQECVRSIGGVIYCEACLAARLNNPGTVPPSGPVYVGLPAAGFPNPGLALGLGFIPGVGAMYNGQFVKGLVHVFVFALLCSFSNHESFFGILIPFWIAYQVFDAYQTARARRDGTPLPNPFGLNDLGYRLGLQQHPEGPIVPPAAAPYTPPAAPYTPSAAPGSYVPPAAPFTSAGEPPSAQWTSYVPPEQQGFAAGFTPGSPTPGSVPPAPGYTYVPGANPGIPPYSFTAGRNDLPTGAIVLIGLGVLFLLGSLGIFHDDWIGKTWPLLLVGIGVWLFVRRTREAKFAGQVPPPVPPPTSPTDRNPL